MDYNRQKGVQLEYLRLGMPDGFSFSNGPAFRNDRDDVEGFVYYNDSPCAIVIICAQSRSVVEQTDNAKRSMRQYDIPYALVFGDDSWRFFLLDNEEIIEKGKIHAFFDVVQQAVAKKSDEFTIEEVDHFLRQWKKLSNQYSLSEEFRCFVERQRAEEVINNIEIAPFELAWNFKSDFEQDMFTALVGSCTATELCRYTTLDSLFRILSKGEITMCGIACMNDKSECYYVDRYFKHSSPKHISDFSLDEVRMLNSFFILSCSDKSLEDNLLMWRMYANEATGVCLNYSVDSSKIIKPFYLAKVSYAKEDGTHPELDFVRDCMELNIHGRRLRIKGLSLWKHFFKQYEYRDENEVRLLYYQPDSSQYRWIKTADQIICPIVGFNEEKIEAFPLILSKIILGPKSPENDTNLSQIRFLLDCKHFSETDKIVSISFSNISSYR